jgi:hypothetical protein
MNSVYLSRHKYTSMKKSFAILFVAVVFTMCNPAKQETATADSTIVQPQDSSLNEQPIIDAGNALSLTSTKFEDIPSELQQFLEAVHDQDKLANYVDTTVGCFIIEEGPGVYPIVSEVKETLGLFANSEFLLFMNTPQLSSGYFINQENVDPCNLPAEGIYFWEAKKNSNFLLKTFQSHLAANNEEMTEEIKSKLNTLDAAMVWSGTINLPNKTDDLNTFDVRLALVDKKIYLAAIDTRGCGM